MKGGVHVNIAKLNALEYLRIALRAYDPKNEKTKIPVENVLFRAVSTFEDSEKCKDKRNVINQFVWGQLKRDEMLGFWAHLENCISCLLWVMYTALIEKPDTFDILDLREIDMILEKALFDLQPVKCEKHQVLNCQNEDCLQEKFEIDFFKGMDKVKRESKIVDP